MSNDVRASDISGWRAALDIFRVTFKASPRSLLGSTIEPVSAIFLGFMPVIATSLIDAVIRADRRHMVMWAVFLAVACLASMVGSVIGTTSRVNLTKAVGHAYDRIIAESVAHIRTLDALEDEEFARNIELLDNRGNLIAGTVNGWLNSMRIAAELLSLIVSSVLIWPWLLILPLVTIPAMFVEKWADSVADEAEGESAPFEEKKDEFLGLLKGSRTRQEVHFWGSGRFIGYVVRGHLARWRAPLDGAADRRAGMLAAPAFLQAAVTGILVILMAFRVVGGVLSVGDLAGSLLLISRLQQATWAVPQMMNGLYRSTRTGKRVLWVKEYARVIQSEELSDQIPSEVRAHGEPTSICFHDVGYTYPGASSSALSHVNVDIPVGATVALVGINGSGKSTFIDLLLGLREPTNGTISFPDGHIPIETASAVFQDSLRYEATLADNVWFGNPGHVHECDSIDQVAMREAIDDARLTTFLRESSVTADQMLGHRWVDSRDLSGGQWQRLAIARARYRHRTDSAIFVTVYDEATSALDAYAEAELSDILLYAPVEGTITAYVTHRISIARNVDFILAFDHGKLAEFGTHEELLKLNGIYSALYEAEAKGYE